MKAQGPMKCNTPGIPTRIQGPAFEYTLSIYSTRINVRFKHACMIMHVPVHIQLAKLACIRTIYHRIRIQLARLMRTKHMRNETTPTFAHSTLDITIQRRVACVHTDVNRNKIECSGRRPIFALGESGDTSTTPPRRRQLHRAEGINEVTRSYSFIH